MFNHFKNNAVSGSKDGNAYVWSVAGAQQQPPQRALDDEGTRAGERSSDGRDGVDGSGAVERTPLVALRGHRKEVTHVAWCTTDFGRVATCSDDCTVRLWTVPRSRAESDAQRARAERRRAERASVVGGERVPHSGGGGAKRARSLVADATATTTPVTARPLSLGPPAIRRRGDGYATAVPPVAAAAAPPPRAPTPSALQQQTLDAFWKR